MRNIGGILKKYGWVLLLLLALYNMLDEVPRVTYQLGGTAVKSIYVNFQPSYTSEPSSTDWAYSQKSGWKGNKSDANPILENMPNHIFYIAVFIMVFAMTGFMVILVVNAGKSWA